jgi:hypothetical protein
MFSVADVCGTWIWRCADRRWRGVLAGVLTLVASVTRRPRFGAGVLRFLVPLVIGLGSLAVSASPALAIGRPVVIDGFGSSTVAASPFTRAVSALPAPETSTTPQGTFSAGQGVATMTMSGTGNGESGTTLNYTPTSSGSVDLTGGGNNNQILVSLGLVNQVPEPGQPTVGVNVSITATDSSGGTAVAPLDAIGNFFAFNAAFPFSGFSCTNDQCATTENGQLDFAHITSLSITFEYPGSGSGGGSLTVEVNELWATPAGGAPPSVPSPSVSAPATAVGVSSTAVNFQVAFADDQGAAPVTNDPPSDSGLRAQDLQVFGSAFGGATPNVTVSGGPSTYNVAVTGMTQDGGITVDVPAGIVDDAWGQLNVASSGDPTVAFTKAIAPKFASAGSTTFTVGRSGSFTINALGGSPTPIPAPGLSIEAGSLPSGVSLTDKPDA